MTKEKKNLLVFGYGLALIIGVFVLRHGWKAGHIGPVSWIFLGIAAALVIITAWDYRRLKPFYNKWMAVAGFIGEVISRLILGFLYYFIFGIVGIMLRLLRKDLLDRGIEPEKETYWIKRGSKPFDKSSCEKQF